jgi:hypothetical protein
MESPTIIQVIKPSVLKRVLEKFEVTEYDLDALLAYLNLALNRYIKNSFDEFTSVNQRGGFPEEYFTGVPSPAYDVNHTQFSQTFSGGDFARMPLMENLRQPINLPYNQAGGATRLMFSIPKQAWMNALKEKGYANHKFSERVRKHGQELLNDAFVKAIQGNELTVKKLRAVLKTKLYRIFGDKYKY